MAQRSVYPSVKEALGFKQFTSIAIIAEVTPRYTRDARRDLGEISISVSLGDYLSECLVGRAREQDARAREGGAREERGRDRPGDRRRYQAGLLPHRQHRRHDRQLHRVRSLRAHAACRGCIRPIASPRYLATCRRCNLHRPGSVAYVSRSGGMSNELNNIIAQVMSSFVTSAWWCAAMQ